MLRISAFTHASLIGLEERFLALCEMTVRESLMSPSLLVSSHQSLLLDRLLDLFERLHIHRGDELFEFFKLLGDAPSLRRELGIDLLQRLQRDL